MNRNLLNKQDFSLIKKLLSEYQTLILLKMCNIVNMEDNVSDKTQQVLNKEWQQCEKVIAQLNDLLKKLY